MTHPSQAHDSHDTRYVPIPAIPCRGPKTGRYSDTRDPPRGYRQPSESVSGWGVSTHVLSWCFRIQGLGGFHPVPWYNSNCTKERSSRTIQVPGTGWIPPSPWILKPHFSPCVDSHNPRHRRQRPGHPLAVGIGAHSSRGLRSAGLVCARSRHWVQLRRCGSFECMRE